MHLMFSVLIVLVLRVSEFVEAVVGLFSLIVEVLIPLIMSIFV